MLTKTLLRLGKIEIGLLAAGSVESPFLGMGTILASFQFCGKITSMNGEVEKFGNRGNYAASSISL